MSNIFSKITNESLKEKVIRELENKILSGELQPGDRLPPERDIAASMGISRSLVNLCILELEHKGFVKIVPRQGTFVNDYKRKGTPQMLMSLMNYDIDKMDWNLFDNMMDMRRLFEYECTNLAVKNARNEDFQQMEEALRIMEKHENINSFIDGNFAFHYALISASGNAVYAMIFNSFSKAMHFFFKIYFTSNERRDTSIDYHKQLYEALLERNEKKAHEAMKNVLEMGIIGLASVFKR
ncbi:MAG: FadR family transcriptional regulator [Clostridia bacterium]|nr:FadR family transcriptional regulator [Clostridia bacterium]